MEAPICLIENTTHGKLVANPDAINILSGINQPVVVVSIIGMYRTGKSYLMNKLAGSQRGFKLGDTLQPETKGIWMWCVPHPIKKDHTLVLLDTEGLEGVGRWYFLNDMGIITLALLLSSTMVYNSKGTIDKDALNNLTFLTDLPKFIKLRSKENQDEAEFSRHLPFFIWALRDFPLNLEIDGERISADEYMEKALKHKQPYYRMTLMDMIYSKNRWCLQTYFGDRKCFVFDIPTTNKEFLQRLEEVPDDELNRNFVDQCKEFCDFIWKNADTKRVNKTVIVTGHRLGELVKIYTEALCSSKFVCMEDAMLALAEKENEAAIQESTQYYEDKMKTVGLPTETLNDFMTLSGQYEDEALQIFPKRSFNDNDLHFWVKFKENICKKREEFSAMNEAKSWEVCQTLIKKHSVDFEKALKDGAYHTQGGHAKFKEDLKVIENKYNVENGKGVKAEEVLLIFIMSQQSYEFLIIQEDNALNQKQKEEEEENARKKNVAVEKKLQKLQETKMKLEREKWIQSLKKSMKETDKQERGRNAKINQFLVEEESKLDMYQKNKDMQAQKEPSGTSWYDPIINFSKGLSAAVFPGSSEKGGTEATKKNEPSWAVFQSSSVVNPQHEFAIYPQKLRRYKNFHDSPECAKKNVSLQQGDPLECKLCGKDEDSAFLALPVVKRMVYRLELQSAGLFRCSKTGIKFQVTRPVTIEYEVDSWNSYSSLFHNLQSGYEILGPLFNIHSDLEPGVVSEVYLPHCLCLKGFKGDTSYIKCAHFKDDNITLEAPTRVEPYYVVLENPTFSPIGILLYPFMWLRDGITQLIPFHGMVLIYWKISGVTDPDHRKFRIHLYLMPYNQSVELDINSFEQNLGYGRLYKPHQTDFLYCGRKYEVKASQNARVLPKTLLFQSSYISGLYPYTEVTVDDKETYKSFGIAVEDGDSSMWQAEVDRGDINDLQTLMLEHLHLEGAAHVSASGEHFMDKHRPALIQAISPVEPILEELLSPGLLIDEQYGTICSKRTSQEQMRELYRYITHWGNGDKDKVYQILWNHNRPVIKRLEAEGY
ncbi:uncharacterized protein LOC143923385 isoform X2 [Lithobates pipiens]